MAFEIISPRLMGRMLRAARLERSLYAEVKADPTATSQAATVVLLVGLAHALGASLRSVLLFREEAAAAFVIALITETTFWAVASFAIYWVGQCIFGRPVSYGQVLRPFGFACGPGLLILVAALASLARGGAEIPAFVVLILWRGAGVTLPYARH